MILLNNTFSFRNKNFFFKKSMFSNVFDKCFAHKLWSRQMYSYSHKRCYVFTSILTQFHQKTVQKKIEVMDLLVTSAALSACSVTAVFDRVNVKLQSWNFANLTMENLNFNLVLMILWSITEIRVPESKKSTKIDRKWTKN